MNQHESPSLRKSFLLRNAVKDDLDSITDLHRDGFTEEPYELYCYPGREKYPGDYWKYTRKEYESYLAQPEKYVVQVIDCKDEDREEAVKQVAGLALWNVAVKCKSEPFDRRLDERRDVNKKHCEAFFTKASQRFDTFFAEYDDKQINLATLVVHPDYRRCGGGTLLMSWGLNEASDRCWPTTLCASPLGELLYRHLDFKKIGTEVVQVDDEEEKLLSAVMVREATVGVPGE